MDSKNMVLSLQTLDTDIMARSLTVVVTVTSKLTSTISNQCSAISVNCGD